MKKYKGLTDGLRLCDAERRAGLKGFIGAGFFSAIIGVLDPANRRTTGFEACVDTGTAGFVFSGFFAACFFKRTGFAVFGAGFTTFFLTVAAMFFLGGTAAVFIFFNTLTDFFGVAAFFAFAGAADTMVFLTRVVDFSFSLAVGGFVNSFLNIFAAFFTTFFTVACLAFFTIFLFLFFCMSFSKPRMPLYHVWH